MNKDLLWTPTRVTFVAFLLFSGPALAERSKPGVEVEAAVAEVGSVVRLRELYSSDEAFRADLDAAFRNLQPLPGGADNPWKGKGFEDLCDFFEQWHRFVPRPRQSLSYITEVNVRQGQRLGDLEP